MDRVNLFTLFLLILLPVASTHAQKVSDQTITHLNRLDSLRVQVDASRQRIFAMPPRTASEHIAGIQLGFAHDALASSTREFGALIMAASIASLVTEPKLVPKAREFLGQQRGLMSTLFSKYIDYIEYQLPRGHDAETSRLLLQTRDLLRTSRQLVDNFDPSTPNL